MPAFLFKRILFVFFGSFMFACSFAQNQCPPNIDFETGNFTNWECRVATRSNIAPPTTYNWNPGTSPIANQHEIISSTNSARDFYGNFPVVCPNNSGFSVKLGNALTPNGDGQIAAQGISYTYAIPANISNFSILYQYAVVLQEPTGTGAGSHSPNQKPQFIARVTDMTTNQEISCVSFDFIAGSLPGFQAASNSPANSIVWYKDWTPISLNLAPFAGKTIKLEFIVNDCTLGGHFGYAYVDVNSNCNGAIIGTTICRGDTTVSLTAPYGFDTYTWYSDQTFSQVLATTQVLTLNPAPNAGAIFPVVVTPFPGYGCIDTLYAALSLADKPVSRAGADALACKWEQVPLGTGNNPLYTYLWSPSAQVSNDAISNPTGYITSFGPPTEFIVTTTDQASGCFSMDTVLITPKGYDTTLTVVGKTDYCFGQNFNTILSINNSSTAVQWFDTNTPVAGANGTSFIPATTGDYWAQYNQLGCTDTTRSIHFDVFPLPVADFSINRDSQCVTNNSFAFTNNSNISDGTSLSYLWSFSDGTTSTIAGPAKSINTNGTFPVKLLVTSLHNCKDSLSDLLYVLPNVTPGFIWDKTCTNSPTLFTNQTFENGSPSVKYVWDFGNNTSTTLKNPLPFNYDSAALYNVSLTVTALGCEADVKVITKPVKVTAIRKGITYPTLTVPAGYNTSIWAQFDSAGASYKWIPGIQLNSSTIKAPNFFGINDVLYNITITDKNKCFTTDTLQMLVLKKKGWYLPNAFTPNGDGLNDVVRPYLIGMKSLTKFNIYNRLGNLVFSSVRDGEGWDGTYKGRKLETAAFVWTLEYIDDTNKPVMQKGSLMLIR